MLFRMDGPPGQRCCRWQQSTGYAVWATGWTCPGLGAPRKGLRFVFSGDSAPCPALEQAAQGADLLLCDATYALPEQQEQAAQWGHSTFGQSAALAAKAGAKRLWLVHYSPMVTDPEEHLAQAQSIFPAAECGFDGKRITLHYEENEE